MSSIETYKVIIIGCGAVAGGYDSQQGHNDNDMILSHMGAYQKHMDFEVIACVDPDGDVRTQFADHWGIEKRYASLEEAIKEGCAFDVASVTSPTACHYDDLMRLSETEVKLVFAEKPLTDDYEKSSQVVSVYQSNNIAIAVNYFRNYDSHFQTLKKDVADLKYGHLQNVSVRYCKGLLNCGSHAIHLLRDLLGPLTAPAVLGTQKGFSEYDPTVDGVLKAQGDKPVYLIGCKADPFFLWEIDFLFEKGRIQIEDVGTVMRVRHPIESPLFQNYEWLEEGERMETDFTKCFYLAVDNIYHHLNGKGPLLNLAAEALETQKICDILLNLTKGDA